MKALLVVLAACGDVPVDPSRPDGKADDDDAAPTCTPLQLARGPTTKVAQLTGEDDRERGTLVPNQTLTRYGLWGTDLGASFDYGGRTVLLFGDSIPTGDGTRNPAFGDAIAFTTDTDPSDGFALDFATHDDGTFRSPVVPGVALGEYEVPLDGIDGGSMYVWFATDVMMRSVLARSDDNATTFTRVHDLSTDKLVNVSAVLRDGEVYLFGSGRFRESDVFLARVPLTDIEDRSAYRFYAGSDGCAAQWTPDEALAAPLFGPACVGELSAHHVPALDAWLVLYTCDEPRGVQARIARSPTGPWSEPVTIFEPWQDGGYCHFMHTSYDFMMCDAVHDPGRETQWGGEYAPYLVESLTESRGARGAALYFVLSTWNPYNTMLLRSELRAQ